MRVATIEGELCRAHAEQIAAELEDGAIHTINAVASGQIPIGDVIAGAAMSYLERMIGEHPALRNLHRAAQHAAAQAQARRSGSPPPRSSRPQSTPGARRPPPNVPPRPPPPMPEAPAKRAREILGFDPAQILTKEMIEDRRRQLAKVFHPDRQGGSTAAMQRVNQAADVLIAHLVKRA